MYNINQNPFKVSLYFGSCSIYLFFFLHAKEKHNKKKKHLNNHATSHIGKGNGNADAGTLFFRQKSNEKREKRLERKERIWFISSQKLQHQINNSVILCNKQESSNTRIAVTNQRDGRKKNGGPTSSEALFSPSNSTADEFGSCLNKISGLTFRKNNVGNIDNCFVEQDNLLTFESFLGAGLSCIVFHEGRIFRRLIRLMRTI